MWFSFTSFTIRRKTPKSGLHCLHAWLSSDSVVLWSKDSSAPAFVFTPCLFFRLVFIICDFQKGDVAPQRCAELLLVDIFHHSNFFLSVAMSHFKDSSGLLNYIFSPCGVDHLPLICSSASTKLYKDYWVRKKKIHPCYFDNVIGWKRVSYGGSENLVLPVVSKAWRTRSIPHNC